MEQAQSQAGIEDQILDTSKQVKYIDSEWITSLQQRMQDIKAQLIFEDYWTPTLKRSNDKMIMTQILQINLSINDMKKLNCCRMYLRVTSLADICSSDGKTVMRRYKMVNESTAPSLRKHSHLEWPFQRNPNDRTWKLWRNTMRKIIPTFGDRLDEPLGHWTTNEDYDKLFDSDHNKILIYDNLQWKKYDVVSKDRRYKKLGDYEGTGIPLKTHTPITDMTNEGTFTT